MSFKLIKKILLFFLLLSLPFFTFAKDGDEHEKDQLKVLGLWNDNDWFAKQKSKKNREIMRPLLVLYNDMIDDPSDNKNSDIHQSLFYKKYYHTGEDREFYNLVKERFPGFTWGKYTHRLFYHWGFEYGDPANQEKLQVQFYKKLPNWRFIVVGDGPEKQRLEDAVYKRGIERMIFPGFTNDTASYYRKASIVCLTSQYEGWPLCLAEGQAYGVVPIAFGCTAGIKDIVSYPMEDGVLARPFSCIDYAERLLQLASDEQQLSRMRNKCIEKSKSYTMLRNSQGYCRLLESLVKEQII